MSKCLITGCVLADLRYPRWAYGDLHIQGNVYIFNCARTTGDPWDYDAAPPDTQRQLSFETDNTFEKRGLVVISKVDGKLNEAANNYLESK